MIKLSKLNIAVIGKSSRGIVFTTESLGRWLKTQTGTFCESASVSDSDE